MLVNDVIARLDDRVADLKGRIEGAAELSALIRDGALPPVLPAAFVVPLGLRPGQVDAAAGLFRQDVDEVVGVVLITDAPGDVTGAGALPTIGELIKDTIEAVCGFAPGDEVGVFRLSRGALVSLNAGTVIYQLDFAIADQLRIAG
jgi:hypothetical protein